MGSYRVRFYREERTSVRMDIEVTADSPEAARQRVLDWGEGRIELTEEEEMTEASGKEEVLGGDFTGLEEADDPYAVVEIPDHKAEGERILPLLEGGDLLTVAEIEEKLLFNPRAALHYLFQAGKVAQIRAAGREFWQKHSS
jgi:hypothetical protein